ncbi:PP2C family protein-serine/threonine phosphatase [Parahaliea mediterranea]|uniref:Serine/threonine-protein phosphatase n=1 Tax=Parahaliea mediterranea TaxID=651086 RepID=A0A939DCC5_9GAMM|nr:protein phosphatase 2C domain-containing protein [Parahaliea mediterranea]MBN7794997.1 serine/threonine-protein phosphatase [Parahaliea mediterranea]
MKWQIATQTHRGNVRPGNEDALLVDKRFPLLLVADGMGGHEAGEVASRMLVDGLGALALPVAPGLAEARRALEDAIQRCHREVIDYAARHQAGRTVGSTVVTMLVVEAGAICVWAGDSRLYRVRHAQLRQLTEDHSRVAELVRVGALSSEEARQHPAANIITRAVGASPRLELAADEFDVCPGDTYLLCSDGLYNEVSAAELLQAMEAADLWLSSLQLLQLCLSRAARDNITFILARPLASARDGLDETLTFYPGE